MPNKPMARCVVDGKNLIGRRHPSQSAMQDLASLVPRDLSKTYQ
jgi:hypothetical protein